MLRAGHAEELEGNRGGEAAGETNPRGVGWDTPHLPPTGSIIVDLQRVLSHVEVMKGFFHRVGGRLVGRFMSPREDTKSKGVNTSGWRKITASQGETVVLRVQEEGAEQPEVIGVPWWGHGESPGGGGEWRCGGEWGCGDG